MANANSLRKAKTLGAATGRNEAQVRYDDTNNVPVVSNGTNWVPMTQHVATFTQNEAVLPTDPTVIFVAPAACEVVGITEIHSTVGGASARCLLKKDTSGVPGSGVALQTDNTNTGFDLTASINTARHATLVGTLATKQLAKGDRLTMDFSGTLTGLAGLNVSVLLKFI